MNATFCNQQHPSEEELIALQLGDAENEPSLRAHVELCASCATLSESIAETLRVFSADAVPAPNLDHNWQRLRGSLPALHRSSAKPRLSRWWIWSSGAVFAAMLAVLAFTIRPHHPVLVSEEHATLQRPGPLSNQPADPALAQQISSAERLLTQVNHTSGPLDDSTRAEAHELLLRNAVYIRTARQRGDLGAASVLEELDPVLTSIDHESRAGEQGLHLRMEWNTRGLLLDLRILEQNDSDTPHQ